jgi:hypothetical protein
MTIGEKPRSTRQHVLTIAPSAQAHLSCFKKFQGISMSDDSSVNTPLPSLTKAHLSARRARALAISPKHLFAESKNNYGASETPSSTTTAARESTASSYTMLYPSSRTSSAEPTESTTSPIEPPSSPLASGPSSPGSPIRVPARLRRMYAQFEGEQRDHSDTSVAAAATGKGKVVIAGVAKTEDKSSPPPTAGASPVVDRKPSPEQRKTQRTGPRKRVPPPAPVPHLIKKSRGRRVPEPDEARERTHICAVPGCSKSFARAEHLKRHVISLHTHEKRTYISGTYVSPFPPFLQWTAN